MRLLIFLSFPKTFVFPPPGLHRESYSLQEALLKESQSPHFWRNHTIQSLKDFFIILKNLSASVRYSFLPHSCLYRFIMLFPDIRTWDAEFLQCWVYRSRPISVLAFLRLLPRIMQGTSFQASSHGSTIIYAVRFPNSVHLKRRTPSHIRS